MSGGSMAVTGWARSEGSCVGDEYRVRTMRREEPTVITLVTLLDDCLTQAGVVPGSDVGLVLAVGSAIAPINAGHARAVALGDVRPRAFIYTTPNAITAQVGILSGLKGETLTVPESSSPFWTAFDLLAAGRASAVIAGGVSLRTVSTGQEPLVHAGLLCLETLTDASRRGTPVQGQIILASPKSQNFRPDRDEATVSKLLCAGLKRRTPLEIDCGRRGTLRFVFDSHPMSSERPHP